MTEEGLRRGKPATDASGYPTRTACLNHRSEEGIPGMAPVVDPCGLNYPEWPVLVS